MHSESHLSMRSVEGAEKAMIPETNTLKVRNILTMAA
jgi:hypothetical protein